MIQEYLCRLPDHLGELKLPAANHRAVWDGLPEGVRTALIRRGEEYLGWRWPVMTCGDYLTFSRTGDRSRYEQKCNPRQQALCALALAECAEHRGRFLDDLIDGIWFVCEESGWQLPAHNTYIRDTPTLPLPDTTRPVPDLFACESAANLSLIRALLGEELEAAAPGLCRRVRREVDTRVVAPYLREHFWWMGNGDEPVNNWTSWCTQNVLLAAFTSGYEQDVKRRVVKQAAYSLDCFLNSYGPDGCCEEGAEYYHHAGITLWGALEVLDRVSGGVFAPLFREEKLRNIAAYIVNVHVDGDYYLNYADCMPKAGLRGAEEYLFGQRTQAPGLCALAAADVSRRESRDLPDSKSLFERLLDALYARELAVPAPPVPPAAEVFYPSTGLWIARDEIWCVSLRAGHNGVSHGHCDAGSLIVYRRGRPLLIDVGVETYSAKTFSPERFSIWTMRSDWHNLPTIGGRVQGDGKQYAPAGVKQYRDGNTPVIELELSPAYPGGGFSYTRRVTLERGKSLTVTDRYQGGEEAVLSLIFAQRPVWRGGVLETSVGSIRLEGAAEAAVEAVPIQDPHLRRCWPDTLYRVLVPVQGELRLEFLP